METLYLIWFLLGPVLGLGASFYGVVFHYQYRMMPFILVVTILNVIVSLMLAKDKEKLLKALCIIKGLIEGALAIDLIIRITGSNATEMNLGVKHALIVYGIMVIIAIASEVMDGRKK